MELCAERDSFRGRRVGPFLQRSRELTGRKAELDDPVWPFLCSDCRNLLWTGAGASSGIYAGSSGCQTDAGLGSASPLWGYPVGAFLLVAGAALLINIRPRTAAGWIGVLMTMLAAFFYLPILALTRDPSQMTEAINFDTDTLMFGGTALLVAGALPVES